MKNENQYLEDARKVDCVIALNPVWCADYYEAVNKDGQLDAIASTLDQMKATLDMLGKTYIEKAHYL